MRRLALVALALAGCASSWRQPPYDVPYQEAPAPTLHPSPAERHISQWNEYFQALLIRPAGKPISPGIWLRAIGVGPPALDVNAFGQVPDSTWFTNRIGRHPLTPDEIRRGPMTVDGPASGPLTLIAGKSGGTAAGFVVKDPAGDTWFVKFDPPALPELTTGAEAVVTRLMWAAGWHVPENVVVYFDPARLQLDPEAHRAGYYGEKLPATRDWFDQLVGGLPRGADGQVRALFSRGLPGHPIGPFPFTGFRADDPNDRVPHERRRSLRGMWVFTAWVNDSDMRETNTLDTFREVDAARHLGYVEHFRFDFGTSMGAAGPRPKFLGEGDRGIFDWGLFAKALFSFGAWYPDWDDMPPPPWRAAGISFESRVFDPDQWRPIYPNPLFDAADARDTYWAASILARFGPDAVRAALDAGRYTEPGAARWLWRVLWERRAKLLRSAFARVLPLDDPRVEGWTVALTDLAVTAGVGPATPHYRWTLRDDDGADVAAGESATPSVDLRPWLANRPGFFTLTWRRGGPRVDLHLRADPDGLLPVALDREVD